MRKHKKAVKSVVKKVVIKTKKWTGDIWGFNTRIKNAHPKKHQKWGNCSIHKIGGCIFTIVNHKDGGNICRIYFKSAVPKTVNPTTKKQFKQNDLLNEKNIK